MEHQPTAKQPLLNNTLKLFMLAMILANTGSQMYETLLPLYLKDLEAGVAQVGLFFTLSRVFPLVLQILGGWISDSLGRLRSIAMGSIAGVCAYVVFVLAPTWQWVLLAAAASSVTRSLIGPSFTAFIAEQSSEENRARVFGITGTLFMVVAVVGPPLGGWLAGAHGFKVMLTCAGCLYTVAAVIRLGMARVAARGSEASPKKLSLGSLRANLGAVAAMVTAGGLLTWILISDGALDIAFSTSFTLMPLYLEDIGGLSIEQIGLLNSVFGIFSMLLSIPAGWLADKKSERAAIVSGFLVQFAALLVFFQTSGFWGYAVVWALFGVGNALTGPAYQSLTSKVVPERLRGTAFGLLHSSLGIFSLPAPAIGAQLWERVSPRFPFQVTAGALLACVVPVWFKFRLPEEEQEAR
jgi:MFS family permease